MKIGYARISTRDQNINSQVEALLSAGCEKIYEETASGSKTNRPILNNLLEHIREGDVLVICKLDRLGRSLHDLIVLVNKLMISNVGLCSLNDPIDTTTSSGRLIFNIFASVAEFEREIIRERTNMGLLAARSRGRIGGRPKGLSKQSRRIAFAAETLYKSKTVTVEEILENLHISRGTFYKYLRFRNVLLNQDIIYE